MPRKQKERDRKDAGGGGKGQDCVYSECEFEGKYFCLLQLFDASESKTVQAVVIAMTVLLTSSMINRSFGDTLCSMPDCVKNNYIEMNDDC